MKLISRKMRYLRFAVVLICVAASLAHSGASNGDDHSEHPNHTDEHQHEQQNEPTKSNTEEELNDFDLQHVKAGILSLTDETFNSTVAAHPAVLVLFYAPWCIHSRALAPEYLKAGFILKAKNSAARLARIDASTEKKTAERFDVKGYPTLKYIKGDAIIDYAGGKTGKSIASWVETKLLPAALNINSVEEADKFAASQGTVVLGLFSGSEASENAKNLEEAAFAHMNEIPCGIAKSADILAHFGVTNDTIFLFKNVDKERLQFQGPFEVESIASFVKQNKLPLVVEFSHATAPDIFGGNVTKHALLFVSKSQAYTFKSAVNELKEPARTFKDRVIFIYVDVNVDENEKILQFFGVRKEDPPAFRMIALDRNMAKYHPKLEVITAQGIAEFVKEVLDGTIDPHLPSQELPDDWDKSPVKVLVSKNFDQVTMDQGKTVFVMFYAPWCEHSKELAPIWQQLAEEYASNDTIVIAKMDSSQNELSDMKIMSFPTLKLFPAKSNSVFDYPGVDRSLANLKVFLDSGGKVQPGNDKKPPQPADEDQKEPEKAAETSDSTDAASVESGAGVEGSSAAKAKEEL